MKQITTTIYFLTFLLACATGALAQNINATSQPSDKSAQKQSVSQRKAADRKRREEEKRDAASGQKAVGVRCERLGRKH